MASHEQQQGGKATRSISRDNDLVTRRQVREDLQQVATAAADALYATGAEMAGQLAAVAQTSADAIESLRLLYDDALSRIAELESQAEEATERADGLRLLVADTSASMHRHHEQSLRNIATTWGEGLEAALREVEALDRRLLALEAQTWRGRWRRFRQGLRALTAQDVGPV